MSAQISKFLSYVLRHAPESIGLSLDSGGWAHIAVLLEKATAAGTSIDRETLDRVVAESDKKRFTVSEDGLRIRAAQGHSITVSLGHACKKPPAVLYHGSATRFLDSILAKGLVPGQRQQVHLSPDVETALAVGSRHGKPIVFAIDCDRMHSDAIEFYQADNGVWLTDAVPPAYLSVWSAGGHE